MVYNCIIIASLESVDGTAKFGLTIMNAWRFDQAVSRLPDLRRISQDICQSRRTSGEIR